MEKKRKILPLAWFAMALVSMTVLHYLLPLIQYVRPPFHYAGVFIGAFAMVMTVMAAGAFKKADTGLVPFDEATALVTDGFFRFTRNPMYLGMVLFLLGMSILFGSFSTLFPIPLFAWIIRANFIVGEERFMEAAFGARYLEYKKKVRRWI
jgi:protein-S-isoprenylcysteine O-methyltransferase Ste14